MNDHKTGVRFSITLHSDLAHLESLSGLYWLSGSDLFQVNETTTQFGNWDPVDSQEKRGNRDKQGHCMVELK